MGSQKPSGKMPAVTPDMIWAIEQRLAEPRFRGVPIGSASAHVLLLELFLGNSDWSWTGSLRNRARLALHTLRPKTSPPAAADCAGKVLVTWTNPGFRHRGLVFPVVEAMGPRRCAVLCRTPEMLDEAPAGTAPVSARHQMRAFEAAAWRRDYRACWPQWRAALKEIAAEYGFPAAVYHRLADAIASATQQVAGFQRLLADNRPAAVLTEYDRDSLWAGLILSANLQGIPTWTMVHGTLGERGTGFVPLLADKVLCWGELNRAMFVAAGTDPARTVIAGCPRLTRGLAVTEAEARSRLGLDPAKGAVMMGMANYRMDLRMRLAECFCRAVADAKGYSAFVRLHPTERIETYDELAGRFPTVRFMANTSHTIDEALAAADVIVVHSSGIGSDALVKGKLTVVLDVIDYSLGHAEELLEHGGCPRARSAEELSEILDRIYNDAGERERLHRLGDGFATKFCAFYGRESAERIAEEVLGGAGLDAAAAGQ